MNPDITAQTFLFYKMTRFWQVNVFSNQSYCTISQFRNQDPKDAIVLLLFLTLFLG